VTAWPIQGPESFEESNVGRALLAAAHKRSALETLSELLRRDREGDHVLTDSEYNAICYAIDAIIYRREQ
jgi:hypothetical protein